MLHKTIIRFIIFSVSWFLFWIISTKLYFHFIHDVGAVYWSLGVWGFPIIVILFYLIDQKLKEKEWFEKNIKLYMFAACFSGMLLYYPVGMLLAFLIFRLLKFS